MQTLANHFQNNYIDASNQAVGRVLTQKDENNVNRPVCYYSKKFSMSQRNYSTTDKEALALILSVRAFKIYLNNHTVVYTDHEPLKFIYANVNTNQRLQRWSLELQSYDLVINHVRGKDNVLADFLSRPVEDKEKPSERC